MYAMMDQARTRASAKATAAPLGMSYMFITTLNFGTPCRPYTNPHEEDMTRRDEFLRVSLATRMTTSAALAMASK